MVNILQGALAGVAEKLINGYLALDPESLRLLEPLQGKTLQVSISDWSVSVFLAPRPQGFSVYFNSENEAVAQLSGRLLDILEFAFSDHPQSLVSSGRVKQAGDIHVLQAYQRFIECSQVDWEGLLAKVIGDAAAFEICKTAKNAKNWHQNACHSSNQDLKEYLQEEKRLVPPREEIEDFYEDIATLREDVDRLEAKINQLK